VAINVDAVGLESPPHETSWTSKDSLLYALGVGAGARDPTGFELAFTTENSLEVTQQALPTMSVVLGASGPDSPLSALGDVNYALMLHGSQSITLHQPLPAAGAVRSTMRIAEIWDKGKAAIVVLETNANNVSDGQPMFTNRSTLFFRGEGGWGGQSGPKNVVTIPDRSPDTSISWDTRSDQALLYRLNGDRNPLHSDPVFAAGAGFDRPILHGLCTFGFTGRALLHGACESDPDRFGHMDARFTSPVMPGETLEVHLWTEDDQVLFQTTVGDRTVLDAGVFRHR